MDNLKWVTMDYLLNSGDWEIFPGMIEHLRRQEELTMATREEMGKALCGIWEAVLEHDGALDREERWSRIAERFAAWLREQEDREARIAVGWQNPSAYGTTSAELDAPRQRIEDEVHHARMEQMMRDIHENAFGRSLRCPKGHVLTHPDDIERRYCGECREYLPERG